MAANSTCRTFSFFLKQMRQTPCKRIHRSLPRPPALFYSTDKEQVNSNRFYEKYAEKIKLVEESQRNFHQAKERSSNVYETQLNKEIRDFKTKAKRALVKKKRTISANSPSGSQSSYGQKIMEGELDRKLTKPETMFAQLAMGLDAIMHLEKIMDKSPDSIEKLWREYHRDEDSVSAAIPSSMYDVIQERAREYPAFIYPVPRNNGYELMVGEFSDHQCYLTSVLHYQTLGENAPWLVAFTHFTEIKETKGIVLMVGEVDTTHVATHEALFIANLIQLYYGTDDDKKLSLLKTFNTNPDKFDHMSVVKEMQRSTVRTPVKD